MIRPRLYAISQLHRIRFRRRHQPILRFPVFGMNIIKLFLFRSIQEPNLVQICIEQVSYHLFRLCFDFLHHFRNPGQGCRIRFRIYNVHPVILYQMLCIEIRQQVCKLFPGIFIGVLNHVGRSRFINVLDIYDFFFQTACHDLTTAGSTDVFQFFRKFLIINSLIAVQILYEFSKNITIFRSRYACLSHQTR